VTRQTSAPWHAASFRWLTRLAVAALVFIPCPSLGHPLGNFSISQYTAIRVDRDALELRYLIDLAEIPTFQEIQDTGLVTEVGHPSVRPYLARKVEALKDGLRLEVDGVRLPLSTQSSDVIFPPGAGDLPTLKLGVVYRASLPSSINTTRSLHYQDGNFPDRVGWKEIIAVARPGVTLARSSVPSRDRSRELADYPTDLMDSPPGDREARLVFTIDPLPLPAASMPPSTSPRGPSSSSETVASGPRRQAERVTPDRSRTREQPESEAGRATEQPAPAVSAETAPSEPALRLEANKRTTPRNALTDLVKTKELSFGIIVIALAVALSLGAFHALEPGHGKTVVAAYLVGARGTAWHAVLLGLIVTVSHTAGVYVLGAVTLFASRYVVPERLYPWLAVGSGVVIAVVGFTLFLRRYAGHAHPHGHTHGPTDVHHHHAPRELGHEHGHGAPSHHHVDGGHTVTVPALVGLGVTGGIVPCPAALVVLLSSLALNRIGFGLLLIVAFSVGLAAVLIAIGLLMVYARRFMARFQGEGPLIQRWLPLTSSAVITILGIAIAIQGLMTVGILHVKLG
jgi:ABC-type nickel/cobalt efflux system permease component RcnA